MRPPKDWMNEFPAHILSRGREYWREKAVRNLTCRTDGYHADVLGNELYHVEITILQGAVWMMRCTCPYAAEGHDCKHMAAVLFAAENGDGSSETLPGLASAEQITAFLRERRKSDSPLRRSVDLHMAETLEEQHAGPPAVDIRAMVQEYADEYERAEYGYRYDANPVFCENLRGYFSHVIDPALGKQQYDSAFRLLVEVIDCLSEYDIFYQVIDEDLDARILLRMRCLLDGSAGTPLEEQVFAWVCRSLPRTVIPKCVAELFTECFNSAVFLRRKLAIAEMQIAEVSEADSLRRYDRGAWVVRKALFLSRLGIPEEEVQELLCRNWQYPEVRELSLARSLDAGDVEKTIALVLDLRRVVGDGSFGREYTVLLLELYRSSGMTDAYKSELRAYILMSHAEDMRFVRAFRDLCSPEEWLKEREDIFSVARNRTVRQALFSEERLYDRLFASLMVSDSEEEVRRYERVFRPMRDAELLAWYEAFARDFARVSGSREQYAFLVSVLHHMQTFPGGDVRAHVVAEEWKDEYRRRPAMMKVLKKGGF